MQIFTTDKLALSIVQQVAPLKSVKNRIEVEKQHVDVFIWVIHNFIHLWLLTTAHLVERSQR